MASSAGHCSARVLVVDDDVDTVETMAMVFHSHGARVYKAYDGTAAIERARIYRPHLVLLDLALPGFDGYQIARALRQQRYPKNPTLVAVSGRGRPVDKARWTEAGFDLHLMKPIEFGVLEHLLSLCRETGTLVQRARQLAHAQWTASRSLLLAQIQMAATFLQLAQTTPDTVVEHRCLAK